MQANMCYFRSRFGAAVVLLWCCGAVVVLLWRFVNCAGNISLSVHCSCGAAVVLLWRCCGAAAVLLWCCGAVVVLLWWCCCGAL